MASIGPAAPTNLTVSRESSRDLALQFAGAGYGYGNAKGGRELSLALLWRVLVEWRWLILAAVGTSIAGAVLITLLTPLK